MSQLLATDLFYATDSAGWVWKKFKVLNDKADYDGDSIVSYTINKKTLKIPNIERISRLINGGTEGLQNRTENYNVLKNIFFQVQSACKNSDKIK
jgi:hypothetical protein